MGGNTRTLRRLILVGILGLFAMSANAHAALPGQNGVIAFETQGSAWGEVGIIDPIGSSTEMLDGLGPASDLSFFPNGKRVVYVTGSSEIRSADFPSWHGDKMLLGSTAGWGCCVISHPVVSPSENEIYFGVWDPNSVSRALWALNLRNRSLRLIKQGAIGVHPVVSPDGSTIAIGAVKEGEPAVLFMNPDGTRQRFIDTGGIGGGVSDLSPDGKRITFTGSPDGEFSYLYEQELGSNADPTRIEIDARDVASASDPVYSPDGRYLAFMGDDFGGTGIVYRVRLSDGRVTQLGIGNYGYEVPTDWQRTAVAVPRSWMPRAKVLRLQTFAASRVRVSGRSVRTSMNTFEAAGTHRIQVKLKRKAQRTLRSKGQVSIRIQIAVRNVGERWSHLTIRRIAKST